MKELEEEYTNLQNPLADPLSLEEADSQSNVMENLLAMLENFTKGTRRLNEQLELKELMEDRKREEEESVITEQLTKDAEFLDEAKAVGTTDELQGAPDAIPPFLSPTTTSTDQIQNDEPQISEKLPEESITEAPSSPGRIPPQAGNVDNFDRFKLILETFNNLGEIMLFEESELVVTDPRQFTQELVKNIMDHEILNNSHPCKPQEIENILYRGCFVFLEACLDVICLVCRGP